jgi:hypothetical protein
LFIFKKALQRHIGFMRGSFALLSIGLLWGLAFASPMSTLARESGSAGTNICPDPKYRHIGVRPFIESIWIRKGQKLRIRHILM